MNTLLEMQTPVLNPAPSPKALKPAKKKILLVDDDAAIRQILVRLLQEEGYFVLTAANGVEALALADATKFDLVMLDLNMPVKDGWSTFEELTARAPTMPVIIITARPNQLFPALASGVGALLEKPLDFVKLFDTVRSLLEEPEEFRVARRMTGQSSMFRFIPPKPDGTEGKAV
jgi:DNA-binding response OmpR family regulator